MEKSLTRVIGEGTLWFSFNNVALKLLGIGSTFIILAHLNVHEYGLLALILSAVPLVSIFILPGLNPVVIADMGVEKSKGNFGRVHSIYANYVKLQLLLSIVAWAVLFFGADFLGEYYEQSASHLRVVSFFFPLGALRTAYLIAMRYRLKFFQHSLLSVLEELLKLAFVAIVLLGLKGGIREILYAMLFSQVFAIVLLIPVFLPVFREIIGHAALERVPFFDVIIRHGKWGSLSVYVTDFNKNIRLWLIKVFLGTDATGLFALAVALYGHTTSLIPLNTVLDPIIPQHAGDTKAFTKILVKSIKYQTLAYMLIGVFASIVFPPIVASIIPKYAVSLDLYRFMLPAIIAVGFLTTLNPAFHALKAQRDTFVSCLLRLGLTLVIMPASIVLLGVTGIAVEFVLTTYIYAVQRYTRLRKHIPSFNLSIASIFSVDEYDRIVLGKIMSAIGSIHPIQSRRP